MKISSKKMKPLLSFITITLILCVIALPVKTAKATPNNSQFHSIPLSKNDPFSAFISKAQNIDDIFLKCDYFIQISKAYAELGSLDKAKYILLQAYNLTLKIDSELSKSIILYELADKLTEINEINDALEVAKNINFPDTKGEVLLRIANAYLKQGKFEEARDVLGGLQEPFSKVLALNMLINNISKDKTFEKTVKLQDIFKDASIKIKNLDWFIFINNLREVTGNPVVKFLLAKSSSKKTNALVLMANNHIDRNLLNSANNLLSLAVSEAGNIQSQLLQDEALSTIATSYARIGNFSKSMEIINSIKSQFYRSEALSSRSTVYAKNSDFVNSLLCIKMIDSEYHREYALSELAIQYIKCKREKEALGLLDLATKIESKDRIYSEITNYYLSCVNYKKSIEAALNIKDDYLRFNLLLRLVTKAEKNGYSLAKFIKAINESIAK